MAQLGQRRPLPAHRAGGPCADCAILLCYGPPRTQSHAAPFGQRQGLRFVAVIPRRPTPALTPANRRDDQETMGGGGPAGGPRNELTKGAGPQHRHTWDQPRNWLIDRLGNS